MKPLNKHFFNRDTVTVAQDLLGSIIVRNVAGTTIMGIISETEAYKGSDPACHAYRGITKRTAPLFGPVGHTYVYFVYGCYFCLNIVARDEQEQAGGILLRSIIPLTGLLPHQTKGPGKLGTAFGLNLSHNHIDVTTSSELYILEKNASLQYHIIATPRIGISKGQDKLWRFVLSSTVQST